MTIHRLFALAALVAVTCTSVAQAQQVRCQPNPFPVPYPNPGPNPGPNPYPMPVPTGYFLGVTTTTVPVGQGVGQQPVYSTQGGSQTRVAPGYGQPVDGQLVTRVIPNSPAFHAGLEVGDILLDANGYPLDSREDLIAAIQNSQGYLEIKVIDGRTNQLAWVVARTGATDPTPVFGTRNQDSVNGPHQDRLRPALRTGLRDSIQTFNAPLNLETGGRRPPIARRGR